MFPAEVKDFSYVVDGKKTGKSERCQDSQYFSSTYLPFPLAWGTQTSFTVEGRYHT